MKQQIPFPVTFNPLKHHTGFILDQVNCWQSSEKTDIGPELLQVGENLTDLYTGELPVDEICVSCIEKLPGYPLITLKQFAEWLGEREYRKLILRDGSVWVVKQGTDPERFVHVHPAKYSRFTVRVRAATLKTVIALLAFGLLPSKFPEKNLDEVNRIRKRIAGLSPIKNLEENKGILGMWTLFITLQNQRNFT